LAKTNRGTQAEAYPFVSLGFLLVVRQEQKDLCILGVVADELKCWLTG